jgi:hypothetical protein
MISAVKLVDGMQKEQYIFILGEKAGIFIEIDNRCWSKGFSLVLGLNTLKKGRILRHAIAFDSMQIHSKKKVIVCLPVQELTPGTFTFDLSLLGDNSNVIDVLTNIGSFEIPASNTHFERIEFDYGVFRKSLLWQEAE